MYKMGSGAERLTEERKITVKTCSKKKIHTIRVKKEVLMAFMSYG